MNLEKTFALIRKFEGLELKAYKDSVGVWTIGYGTTFINGIAVKRGMVCTKEEAEDWMQIEARQCAAKVSKWLKKPASDGELAAMISLAYNIGMYGLYHSTLLRLFNAGEPKQVVAAQFMKWVHGGGKVIPGLVNRRRQELKIFLS